MGFPCGSAGKEDACNDGDLGLTSLAWDDPLEKGKAMHSSSLAWRIPRGHKESENKFNVSENTFCVVIHFTIFELEMMNYFETARIIMSYHERFFFLSFYLYFGFIYIQELFLSIAPREHQCTFSFMCFLGNAAC